MAASAKNKRSGNPSKRSSAKTWKRNKGEDLTLPSGNVALIGRPGPATLLNGGVLPDTLMPIVEKAIKSGKGMRSQDNADIMKDPEKVLAALDAMDRLMVVVVEDPKPAYHRHNVAKSKVPESVTPGNAHEEWEDIPESARNGEECPDCGETHPHSDDTIYTNEVDLMDKIFIFNFAVGGTRDLERFRGELGDGMGALFAGEGGQEPPVGPAGDSEEGKAG